MDDTSRPRTILAAVVLAALVALPLAADLAGERSVVGVDVPVGPPAPEPAAIALTEPAPVPPSPAGEALPAGDASYYADRFEGRATASGEPYRKGELTAAHRTLPFGSKVRVTNPGNGESVVVRINDRGPFHGRRVIDLSRAAASRLGILERGHGRVELELLP